MVVQEPVQAAIWQCLNYYAYNDATFLAERLFAEVGSDEALFLLATCYYRSGKPNMAYSLFQSKGCPTAQCRYLMARCCLELDRLSEGEAALAGSSFLKPHTSDEIASEFGEAGPYALALLATICGNTERKTRASEAYKHSLKLNPFLWSSFQALCDTGEKPDPSKVFQAASVPKCPVPQLEVYPIIDTENQSTINIISSPSDSIPDTPQDNNTSLLSIPISGIKPLLTPNCDVDQSTPDTVFNCPSLPPSRMMKTRPRVARSVLGGGGLFSPLTPSFGVLPLDTPSPGDSSTNSFITPSPSIDTSTDHPKAPNKRIITRRTQTTKPAVFSQSGNSSNTKEPVPMQLQQTPSPQTSGPVLFPPTQGVRRSSRLFSHANSVKENATKKPSTRGNKLGSPRGPKGKTKGRTVKSATISQPPDSEDIFKPDSQKNNDQNKPYQQASLLQQQQQLLSFQKASADGLLALLREIGKAYLALSQYDCRKAISLFSNLPTHHYNTGWVLCQVGRARFELAEYQQAERLFSEVRRLEPHHMAGMEIYSTTLWHLHKEVALSTLAQDLTAFDPNSPYAWCASGNCFSLQKEHDVAIKFSSAAVQIDPNFAYAYTLLGHEYATTEELDKAMACFRNALRINQRHYNAWYGVGMIYYKQEKFSLAEMHYRKALGINPQSSVLLCHIGVVQHALHKSNQALETLTRAISMDPNNPLCKFHRASILFATEKYQEALTELEELKHIIPKESLVYFIMGKVYKKLGQTHLALANFSWALDLDPKGANNQIKEALDKRYLPDDDELATVPVTGNQNLSDTPGGEDSNVSQGLAAIEEMQLQANESDESL
ncbi:cell division cycle protein 27 homolog [Amphiura filiformis]|uniref:cell division cycle protein 27 homolog n=1 Tax=Amphiura filiformis TaxID=82378 RepID=UPI003B20E675